MELVDNLNLLKQQIEESTADRKIDIQEASLIVARVADCFSAYNPRNGVEDQEAILKKTFTWLEDELGFYERIDAAIPLPEVLEFADNPWVLKPIVSTLVIPMLAALMANRLSTETPVEPPK